MLNKDPKNSFKLALELDQFNNERQTLEKDILKKILDQSKNSLTSPV